jgi:lipid-A-disaccharide synthase-like uncharacterized protein
MMGNCLELFYAQKTPQGDLFVVTGRAVTILSQKPTLMNFYLLMKERKKERKKEI